MPEQAETLNSSQMPSSPPITPASTPRKPSTRPPLGIILLVIIVILLGYMWFSQSKFSGFSQDWQAVFLTNGQVYFGEVTQHNSSQLVLEDIYYLQVTRPLQQTEEGEQQPNPQGELSLVKLGNELHGPTDIMFINRDHVLFVEDLKDDSNVVQAIANYKSGQ